MSLFYKTHRVALPAIFLCILNLSGCGGSSSGSTETVADSEIDSETGGNYKSDLFDTTPLSAEEVSCTLDNGSTTTCYQLTFAANTVGDTEDTGTIGPYCPPDIYTARAEAGVGIYDGSTNPGFQSLVDAAESMDADGYDIVDESGNIRFSDLSQGSEEAGFSYCLSANFDSTLELTYLIPVTPEFRSEASDVGTVGSMGVGINGIPIKGNPPSVTTVESGVGGTGSGNIPALDLCGGHPDPTGYYHWHFVPQSINTVFESDGYNYTAQYGMTCANSMIDSDDPSAFAGLAKDGFPIYAAYDSVDGVDTEPNNVATVDECNGHTHATTDFPDGVYHYHALESGTPNIPPCLMGSFVERDFEIR